VSWQIFLYVTSVLLSAAISSAVAYYAWKRRDAAGAVPLAALMLAASIWSSAYAVEVVSGSLQAKLFWVGIEYIGIVSLPICWLALVLQYTGRGSFLSRRWLSLLFLIPIITVIMVWTNSYHGLIYSRAWIDMSGGYPALGIIRGQWYFVNLAYLHLISVSGILLMLRAFLRSSRPYRVQAFTLLLGGIVPIAASIAYQSGFGPSPYFDITPISFVLSGLIIAVGLFRYGLLDIMPIARSAVIENMADGIVVLDMQGRIIDLNPAALRILGLSFGQAIGKPAFESALLRSAGNILDSGQGQAEVHLGKDPGQGAECYYELSLSAIHGKSGDARARLLIIRDITIRRQAEAALERSEASYRGLFNSVIESVYIHDRDGIILDVNRGAVEMYGYPHEFFIGKAPRDLAAPGMNDLDRLPEIFRQAIEGVPQMLEFWGMRSNGEAFLKEVRMCRGTYFGQEVLVAMAQDITERKKAEDSLRQSEERFRMLAEGAPIGISLMNSNDEFIYLNPMFRDLFGYSLEDIPTNRRWFELAYPDQAVREKAMAHWREDVLQSLDQGKSNGSTVWVRCRDGTDKFIQIRVVLLKGHSYLRTYEDLTDRKRAEEELSETRRRLADIIDFLPDATFVIDSGGKVIAWNRAMEAITGVPAGEMLGKGDYEYSLPFHAERMPVLIDMVLGPQKTAVSRYTNVERRDGVLVGEGYAHCLGSGTYIWGVASPLYGSRGEVVGAIESIRDISERKLSEEKLRDSLREKEVLLREVHHRVKNNLQIISSMLNLQANYMGDLETIEALRDCQNRVRSMSLVHESLYSSDNLARVNFADYLRSLTKRLLGSFGVDKCRIKLHLDLEEIFLDIDNAISCGLIVNELISNSLKHAFPDGRSGQVCIRLCSIEDGGKMLLVIGGDGVGLPADLEFKKASSLGLKLVDGLIKQAKGTVVVDKSRGTVYTIQFAQQGSQQGARQNPHEACWGSPKSN
jgi:PAS domain S-box-containing protein